ncbi:MAG TPA: glycerophosphoryl diester phosphodiesterase membrane domain-containing protein [Petrotogaceae bacterium]|nr:glycerophosphoryl diester phosphodiesterase membrane domain-containing protein [Petrotogaceae bacterium]
MTEKIKLKTKRILRSSLKSLKNNFLEYFIFESIYKTALHFLIIPLMIFIFTFSVKLSNDGTIKNTEFFKLFLDIKGFSGIFIVSLFLSVIFFIELFVLVIINYSARNNSNPSVIHAFITSLKKLRLLFGKGFFIMLVFALLIIPFLETGIESGIIANIRIPDFVDEYIFSTYKLFIPYIILMLMIVSFSVGLIFMINVAVEEDCTLQQAFKKSRLLAKGNKIKIIWIIFIWNLIILAIPAFLIGVPFILLVLLLIRATGFDYNEFTLTMPYIYAWAVQLYYIVISMYVPANICLISEIYHALDQEPKEFKLSVPQKIRKFQMKVKRVLSSYSLVFLSLILTSLFFYTLYSADRFKNSMFNFTGVDIISHRGDSKNFTENTLQAIMSAKDMGADSCEIDVQLTKDSRVVVFHDKSLKRLTGISEYVNNLDYSELIALAGQYVKIPLLEDVLDYAKDNIKLVIELKPDSRRTELVEKVVGYVKNRNMVSKIMIQSLDYKSLEMIEIIEPRIITGFIAYMLYGDYKKLVVDFLNVEKSYLSEKMIKDIHNADKKVWVWTVNSRDEMENFVDMKVDGILTDDIMTLKEYLKEKSEEVLKYANIIK